MNMHTAPEGQIIPNPPAVEIIPPRVPMPPQIAAAVVQVMRGIEKLQKDERNPHANYRYAGIESFLEMLRPLCAEAGLIIVQDEDSYEFVTTRNKHGEERTWLVMLFTFTLVHSSGETWTHPVKRTGMADASMGSQAFGAAQSYALKQFDRSLFQIATGDSEDADAHPQADLPARSRSGKARTAPAKNGDAIKLSAEDSAAMAGAMLAQISALATPDEVADYAKENAGKYGRLVAADQQKISEALSLRKADLAGKAVFA
jgi:hypothetical protein